MTLNVAITGASGMVGTALSAQLTAQGYAVRPVRRTSGSSTTNDLLWDPAGEGLHSSPAAEGLDVLVHLAGENIAAARWSDQQKQKIRDSRVTATEGLVRSLSRLERPPKTLVCASAIGFYGNRGNEELTESSSVGTGFLADVCHDWEQAAGPATDSDIRVVIVRIGVVLSPKGGALGKMLLPFRLGAGGVMGSGQQFMSWIGLSDVVAVLEEAIANPDLHGPVNTVSPQPVTNREFTKTLGHVLKRPTIFPMPTFAARLAFGEMAEELLLGGARVLPKKLTDTGFEFQFPDLESCLRHELAQIAPHRTESVPVCRARLA